jgi:hypothetical protein
MVNAGERSSNETQEEGEGALMAKGMATKSKQKQYKHETNIERAARELRHRVTLREANQVADTIRAARKEEAELETESRIPPVIPPGMETSGFSHKRWKEAYAYLGYLCSRSDENPSKFLRLVADILEGKPAYTPGDDWHDSKITKAYNEAFNRIWSGRDRDWSESDIKKAFADGHLSSRDIILVKNLDHPDEKSIAMPLPTFSQFLDIFWGQNPKSTLPRPPSERSLRRSLARLGCVTRRDKRGRPKEK